MKNVSQFRIWICVISLQASLLFTGCNESGGNNNNDLGGEAAESTSSESSGGSYPNIKGTWSGTYVVYGGTNEFDGQAVTATIMQDRDAVVINTNLPTYASLLTGTIKQNGDMILTDAYDGELWTTHFEPATSSSMRIADFLLRPNVDEPDPPIAVIELSK